MPDIIVHHLENSRSHRILWLLEELDAPYEIVRYRRDKNLRAPAELRRIHALGKSPVVTVDGVALAESGAIMDALIDLHGGRLRPEPATPLHQRYRFFMHYSEGSFAPALLVKLITSRLRNAPAPFFVRPIAATIAGKIDQSFTDPEMLTHLRFLEAELKPSTWFVGEELTAADIMLSFPLEAAMSRGALTSEYPRLGEFVSQVHARPAYRRATERGGPYEALSGT